MFRYLIIFLSLVSLISVVQVHARERIALIIGNAAYQIAPLNNPTHDAHDIANVLRQLGFNVMLETDANQATMERAIRSFGKKLYKDAVGLFYYSGHGIQHNGANYLIPIGAMASVFTPDHFRYKAVNVGYVLDVMKAADNGLNIVILDACRNNPFKGLSKNVSRGLTRMPSAEGTLIAYATSPGKTAADGRERNSPYTKHLLEFLPQPNLPIERILKKVRAAVKQETNGRQTPWYEASIDGEFYFVQNTQNQLHNSSAIWKRKGNGYWLFVNGKQIVGQSNWAGNDIIVYVTNSNQYYLLKNYANRDDDTLRPAILVNSQNSSAIWKRKGNGYWLFVNGKQIVEQSNWAGNDIIVYVTNSNQYYLLKNYANRDDDTLRPAILVNSQNSSAIWKRKGNEYWLFVNGKQIVEQSNWAGNDLIVYITNSNQYYLLKNYANRDDDTLRPAILVAW